MKNIWFKFIYLAISLPLLFVKNVNGAGLGDPAATGDKMGDAFDIVKDTAGENYNTNLELNTVLGDIVLLILSVIGAVFIIFMVYAGYLWMTASGNEQKVDRAKEILRQSIIGVIVIVGAYAIAYFVINIFSTQINN